MEREANRRLRVRKDFMMNEFIPQFVSKNWIKIRLFILSLTGYKRVFTMLLYIEPKV